MPPHVRAAARFTDRHYEERRLTSRASPSRPRVRLLEVDVVRRLRWEAVPLRDRLAARRMHGDDGGYAGES